MHIAIVTPHAFSSNGHVVLDEAESRHLRTVLRVKQGDELRLLDGDGHGCLATISSIDRKAVICEMRGVVESLTPPAISITLFQCVAKRSRMDWLVEKAAELGVARIVPILSARTVMRTDDGAKSDRWNRIAESALRQSGSGWLTVVEPPVKWNAALAQMQSFDYPIFVGALGLHAKPLGEVLLGMRSADTPAVAWVIGPEGDFTPEELEQVLSIQNSIPVSLGTQVLRVETATLFGVSATLAILGIQPDGAKCR